MNPSEELMPVVAGQGFETGPGTLEFISSTMEFVALHIDQHRFRTVGRAIEVQAVVCRLTVRNDHALFLGSASVSG